MKKIISLALASIMLSASLVSCTDQKGEESTADEEVSASVSENEQSFDESEIIGTEVKEAAEFDQYLHLVARYFHYPRKAGDKSVYQDTIYFVGQFCCDNASALDFVDEDKQNKTAKIKGEDFRRVAKNLLGEDFDITDYHTYLETNTDRCVYDADTDVYTFMTDTRGNSIWGGKTSFSRGERTYEQDEDTVTLCMKVMDNIELVYHFDKVVDGGLLYYRLGDVYWNSGNIVTDTWYYNTETKVLNSDEKETKYVCVKLPYYTKEYKDEYQSGVLMFDYGEGGFYGMDNSVMGQTPGFAILGAYTVDKDYVLDQNIAQLINECVDDRPWYTNTLVAYTDDGYDMITGKTVFGYDYVLCFSKPEDIFCFAFGYVRATDDTVIYLGFFRDGFQHKQDIINSVESVYTTQRPLEVISDSLVSYYNKPFTLDSSLEQSTALHYLTEYCVMNSQDLTVHKDDKENSILYIKGTQFRALANALFGEHLLLEKLEKENINDIFDGTYDKEADLYAIPYARGWGGSTFQVDRENWPTVTEEDGYILVTATITDENEAWGPVGDDVTVATYTYKFEKQSYNGQTVYRLLSVTEA